MTGPTQPVVEFDLLRSAKIGALGGLAAVFVATIGMLETFSVKNVIDPILSLAFAVLIGIGVTVGLRASQRASGSNNRLLDGLGAGTTAGSVMAVFLVFIDTVDVRDVFINVSPALIDLMNLQRGLGLGLAIVLGGGMITGLAGAWLGLASPLVRRAIVGSALWVLIVGFVEVILTQIFSEIDLGIALAFGLIGVGTWLLLRYVGDRGPFLLAGLGAIFAVGVVVSQALTDVTLGLKFIPDFLYVNRVGGGR